MKGENYVYVVVDDPSARNGLAHPLRAYDEQLESDLEIEDALLENEWIEESIEYEEEMNAIGIEMAKEDEELREKFEQKKNEIKESLHSFKAKVEKKKRKFEDGLDESFEDVSKHYAEIEQYYYTIY